MKVWRIKYNIIGTNKVIEFIVLHKNAIRAMFLADLASIRAARKITRTRIAGTKTLSCTEEVVFKRKS